ncbi:MAG: hypothetical protein PHW60_00120 [Kiritimatiellae bacterium]|nr:hypothetical protein [Kiritimatiellia bacterium]
MNMVWHLLWKDIRSLRMVVMFWLGWIFLQTMVEAWVPAIIGRPVLWTTYQMVSMAGPILQFVLLLVLIPLVIHQDPTVDARAFWLTRPISRKTLLVSKLGFMGLIVILPVLLGEIIVLACNGIAGRNLLLAVPEILLIVLCRLSIIGVLAMLTANFARFAIAVVSYFVAIKIVGFLMSIFSAGLFGYGHDAADSLLSVSMMQSRDVVASVATILVGCCLLSWQYLTRKTTVSVIMAIMGALGIMTLQSAWHLDFLKGQERAPAVASVNPDSVSLSIANIEPKKTPPFGSRKYQAFNLAFNLNGIPQDRTVEVVDGNMTFTRSNGHSLRGNAIGLDASAFSLDGHVAVNCPGLWNAVEADVGKFRVLNFNPGSTTSNMELNAQFTTTDSGDYAQYVGERATVSGEVRLNLSEYRRAGAAPLKTGACLVAEASRDRVINISCNIPTRDILLRKQTVSLLFAGQEKSGTLDNRMNSMMRRMMPWTDSEYLLLNRKRGNEVVRCESVSPDDLLYMMTMSIRMWKPNRLDYVDLKLDFPELSDEWLKDAELVCFKKSSLGSFKKTFAMKDFLMPKAGNNPKGAATPAWVGTVSPAGNVSTNVALDQGASSTNQ